MIIINVARHSNRMIWMRMTPKNLVMIQSSKTNRMSRIQPKKLKNPEMIQLSKRNKMSRIQQKNLKMIK
jgi:hypothetical protein